MKTCPADHANRTTYIESFESAVADRPKYRKATWVYEYLRGGDVFISWEAVPGMLDVDFRTYQGSWICRLYGEHFRTCDTASEALKSMEGSISDAIVDCSFIVQRVLDGWRAGR